MSILSRYILREFLRCFFLCLLTFITIYLIVDFFERMEKFIRHQADIVSILQFFICKIPMIVYQVGPIAMVIGALLTIGLLARNNELVAMMAAGVNLYRLITPIVGAAVICSVFTWVLSEYIMPYTNRQLDYINQVKIKKKTHKRMLVKDNILTRSGEAIYSIRLFDPRDQVMKGVTFLYFSRDFSLLRRIDAVEGAWDGEEWVFRGVTERRFGEGGEVEVTSAEERVIAIPEDPDSFLEVERETEEMSYAELRRYIDKIQGEGYDSTPYLVDLYAKLAFPVLNFLTVFMGIGFALRTARSGGIAAGIVLSLVAGFIYWILFGLSLSLGHSGTLPPLVAAWAPNLLFSVSAFYLLYTVKQ